jgi:sulfonate transport system ATP-binding protein
MSSLLTIEGVSKSFSGSQIFKDLNLTVESGEIISLLGKSGCGKSTLLRLVAGLDPVHQGQVRVNDLPITGPGRQVGLMFQEPRLFPWLNVRDNVAFGLPPARKSSKDKVAAGLLEEVGLSDSANLLPRQLSGGMAQRVALARALAGEPEVLLLDEPFSALDAFTRMRLQELVLKVWEDYRPTMLLVTHDIEEALYLSDRVVVLGEKPAGVREIIEVKLPRPRNRSDTYLLDLRGQLLAELG